jgi:GTPase SAR1 family protein
MSDAVSVRIAVVGDVGIGKSSLISRYCYNVFFKQYRPTIGIEFAIKLINDPEIGDIKAQFWDMSGRRTFKFFCNGYLLDAHGIIIAFDVADCSSMENALIYINEIKTKFRDNNRRLPKFCFIGLKAELGASWCLDSSKRYEHELYCTSAKENIGVSDALSSFIIECVKDHMTNSLLPSTQLTEFEDCSEDEKYTTLSRPTTPAYSTYDCNEIPPIELSTEDELNDVRAELAETKAERSKESRSEERTLLLRRIVQLGDKEALLLKIVKPHQD